MDEDFDVDLVRRRRVLDGGVPDREIRRRLRSGLLTPLRPGAYLTAAPKTRGTRDRHRLAVRAALETVAAETVVSHLSAAVLHGLDLWQVDLSQVHVTKNRASGGHRLRGLHVHPARLDPADVVVVDGVAVTSLGRTAVDLARTLPFEQAVVTLDHLLRIGPVTRDELGYHLDLARRRRGAAEARRAIAFADGGAESVGESRSRVAMARIGLPAPELQRKFYDPGGAFLGRVDFYWESEAIMGEFDGLTKYGRLRAVGQDPADVVVAEKLREERLTDSGRTMLRWIWSDLTAFDQVKRRFLARAQRHLRLAPPA